MSFNQLKAFEYNEFLVPKWVFPVLKIKRYRYLAIIVTLVKLEVKRLVQSDSQVFGGK